MSKSSDSVRAILAGAGRRSAVLAGALALAGGALFCGSAGPANAAATSAEAVQSSGFLALATPGESFAQIAQAAARSSGPRVAATIEAMAVRVSQGFSVDVPQGTKDGVTNGPATAAELTAALGAARSVTAQPAAEPAADPREFPINGVGCHQASEYYAAWCGKYQFTETECNPEGCTVINKLVVKITVNPGVKTSLVSYTSTYFYLPSVGRLYTDIHFEWWVLCFSSSRQCGTANSKNFEGNSKGKFYPKSNQYLYGDRMTNAFELWIKFVPNGNFYGQEGKTGTALCDEKPETACVY
jgi:hypothetical protein